MKKILNFYLDVEYISKFYEIKGFYIKNLTNKLDKINNSIIFKEIIDFYFENKIKKLLKEDKKGDKDGEEPREPKPNEEPRNE